MEDLLLRNPDFLASICGAGAFAVVVLIWVALVEGDPLPARLRNVTERRSQLREEERRKKCRAALCSTASTLSNKWSKS